jgi:hypothetical protein
VRSAIDSLPSYHTMWKNLSHRRHLGGQVVNEEDQRRTAFVDLELAAVWQGHERGAVTQDEVYQRLDELERLLWRRLFGRLGKVAPGATVYGGFPAEPLAAGEAAAGTS